MRIPIVPINQIKKNSTMRMSLSGLVRIFSFLVLTKDSYACSMVEN